VADLGDLLDHIAAQLPPPTAEEIALYERRHRRAHERGLCDCTEPPKNDVDGEEKR
jgi:hypothetical protein